MFNKTRMFLFAMAIVALITSFIPGEVADNICAMAFIVMAVGWALVADRALKRVKELECPGHRSHG